MKEKFKGKVCAVIALAAMMTTSVSVMAAPIKIAVPSDAMVKVEEQVVDMGAYNIDGYNYFKLRDVAAVMNGTDSNFEVGYDASVKSIALTTNKPYTITGKEFKDKPIKSKTATISNQNIVLNGAEVEMQAYLIDGYNYFQLRDLGKNLGFNVGWDNEARTITLIPEKEDILLESDSEQMEMIPGTEAENQTETESEEAAVYTTKDLQDLIDEAYKSGGSLYLEGTYKGIPGDVVYIKPDKTWKSDFAIFGKNAKIENITIIVDSHKPVWIEGVVFEGNNEIETAVIVKNNVAKSMAAGIIRCEIRNYTGDAVLIENLEPWKQAYNTAFLLSESYFYEYGTDEEQLNAAIAIRPTKAIKAHLWIDNNHFHLENESEDKEFADYAFATDDLPEFLEETTVLWEYNVIQTGESMWDTDCQTSIPEKNWK